MQPMSPDHDNAYKRQKTPQGWTGKADATPGAYDVDEQESQWAVLRHEVEVEDMTRQDERVRPDWEQRDTEDDTPPSRSPSNEPDPSQLRHVDIVVAGVGGGGMNALNRMMSAQVRGVRFIAMNTDSQVLALSRAEHCICLGQHYTKGLGAGGNTALGMRAASESADEIRAALSGADLVFIAAGLGGGTGTGAAPVVASIARKLGALTIGIVTLPFTFEGVQRKRIAQAGLEQLKAEIDALIAVPNDRLLASTGRERSLADAFKLADDVLRQGVQGIAEVINVPGMVNVDFADVRSVLSGAGTALMSIGQGQGHDRARQAAEQAIAGGFLNVTIRGANRVLFNISGGEDMTLFEVNEVAERIRQAIDAAADITFGAVIDPRLKDSIRVTLIAAGMQESSTLRLPTVRMERPLPVSSVPPAAQSANTQKGSNAARPAPFPAAPAQAGRQQRSLDDLRGLRHMGRRHEMHRGSQAREEDGEEVDVPPFLKKSP